MKRLIVAMFAAGLAFGALANDAPITEEDRKFLAIPYAKMTPDQREKRAELMRRIDMIENGGEMVTPGTPRGTIRFVNLQKTVPAASLAKALDAFGALMSFDVAIVDDANCKASLLIKIVEDPVAPALLIAPEDGWAQVNVTKLGDEKTKPAYLAARTRKEMIRAFSFLTAGTSRDAALFGKINKASDLDKIADTGFALDVIMRSTNYLKGMGVKPREISTYRELVERGFEIAPTNDCQKAILDEVRNEKERGPKNALKIVPPKKK